MSADAAIRTAERSGDTTTLVLALLRAGRGVEALKVRGFVRGDLVKRTGPTGDAWDACPACPVGRRGRVLRPSQVAGGFVTVLFEEAHSPCGVPQDTLTLVDIAENNGEAK